MDEVKVVYVKDSSELRFVSVIRDVVFVKEQGFPSVVAEDEVVSCDSHGLLYYKHFPVGCISFRVKGSVVKFERIAILKDYRGKGLGDELIRYFLYDFCMKNFKKVVLFSQVRSKGFYKKYKFETVGEEFDIYGVLYIEMVAKLP